MVDMRELERKGLIKPATYNQQTTQNNDGFVDFSKEKETEKKQPNEETPSSVFGFMENNSSNNSFSTESEGYSKREVDNKIEALDNKIYKMEQRIELLERKAGVQSGTQTNGTGLW